MVELNERTIIYQHVLQEYVTLSGKIERKYYVLLSDDSGFQNSTLIACTVMTPDAVIKAYIFTD